MPRGRSQSNRILIALLTGTSALAVLAALLLILLPMFSVRGEPATAFDLFGFSAAGFASIPAAASLIALALARWRLPRAVAAGTLWFYSLNLFGPGWFYLPAAILQTISIFPGYRSEESATEAGA